MSKISKLLLFITWKTQVLTHKGSVLLFFFKSLGTIVVKWEKNQTKHPGIQVRREGTQGGSTVSNWSQYKCQFWWCPKKKINNKGKTCFWQCDRVCCLLSLQTVFNEPQLIYSTLSGGEVNVRLCPSESLSFRWSLMRLWMWQQSNQFPGNQNMKLSSTL